MVETLLQMQVNSFMEINLPFDDFVHYCLLNWTSSGEYLRHELRRYVSGSKTDEYKFFRCIPVAKSDYVYARSILVKEKNLELVNYISLKSMKFSFNSCEENSRTLL
jgi:hypothetical protein